MVPSFALSSGLWCNTAVVTSVDPPPPLFSRICFCSGFVVLPVVLVLVLIVLNLVTFLLTLLHFLLLLF